jgi:hypothetical protein
VIAVACGDEWQVEGTGTLYLWDWKAGTKQTPALSHRFGLSGLAISPDGKVLACGPLDELLALHDELAALPAVADLHVQRRRAGLPDRRLLRTLAARGRPVHESLLPFGGRTETPEVPP